MIKKYKKILSFLLCCGMVLLFSAPRAQADRYPKSEGDSYSVYHYSLNQGTGTIVGSLNSVVRSVIGESIVGIMEYSNPDPPFYALFAGFNYVTLQGKSLGDQQYDICYVFAEEYDGGDALYEEEWQRDTDPFFFWETWVSGIEVLGYSVSFDSQPDEFVDTTDAFYQVPEYYLPDGKHAFFVIAKNTSGNFGAPGKFDMWVDALRPTISGTLPAPSSITSNKRPTIQALLVDGTSGIDSDSVRMEITTAIETFIAPASFDVDTGLFTYTPSSDFPDGLVAVRIECADHAGNEAMTAFWSFGIDASRPEGWILINGDAASTTLFTVDLSLFAADLDSVITDMAISNDGVFDSEGWQPFTALVTDWELDVRSGVHTVYVKFRNEAGVESEVYTDSIFVVMQTPNTFIVESPPYLTEETSASFKYTASIEDCLFHYTVDGSAWTEFSYDDTATFSDLLEGNHYFQVRAGKDLNGNGTIDPEEIDPSPAAASWTIGTIVPLDRESDRPIRYFGAS